MLAMTVRTSITGQMVQISFNATAGGVQRALVSTARWEVQAWSKRYPNPAANPGKALLNIKIDARYDADHDVVAPHGIIGQSFDGDGVGIDGAIDDYTGKE